MSNFICGPNIKSIVVKGVGEFPKDPANPNVVNVAQALAWNDAFTKISSGLTRFAASKHCPVQCPKATLGIKIGPNDSTHKAPVCEIKEVTDPDGGHWIQATLTLHVDLEVDCSSGLPQPK